jgi:transcriptional adapter 2-alpha
MIGPHTVQADEESLLLEALDMYGLGNWAAVTEHVGGYKSAAEVRGHWFDIWGRDPDFSQPTPSPLMSNVDALQVLST